MTVALTTVPPAFGICMGELAVALQHEIDLPQIQAYWRALSDIPMPLLKEAAERLARAEEFFPKPGRWRTAADLVQAEHRQNRLALPPAQRDREHYYDCNVCDDTGWERHTVRHQAASPCAVRGPECRNRPDNEHTWVTPCPCRPTNPTYQRSYPTRYAGWHRADAS
jgi:hypothetical protein